MSPITTTVFASALFVAGQAMALPQEAYWVEVPVFDDPSDSSDLTGYRTFDLFVSLEDGDVVYAQDFGIAGPNAGLSLGAGQDFFQHAQGSDVEASSSLVGVFPDLTYDTSGRMGELAPGEYQTFLPDWDPNGTSIVWFPTVVDGQPVVPGTPDENNQYWFARVTVSSAGAFGSPTSAMGEYLGGQLFISGEGPNGEFGQQVPGSGVVDATQIFIPNAFTIPAPGATATLGLLGVMALRRKR